MMLDLFLLAQLPSAASSWVMTAFFVAISVIALSYIAGHALSIPSVKGFAKNEAYELGVSIVVLAIALLLAVPGGVFEKVMKGFMLPGVPLDRVCPEWLATHGPYDPATQTFAKGSVVFGQAHYFLGCRPRLESMLPGGSPFVDGVILSKLTRGYVALMVNEFFMGIISSMHTNIHIPTPASPGGLFGFLKDVGISPYIGLGPIIDIQTLLIDFIGIMWATFAAQRLLLVFIEENVLSIFLPFGLVLRALPFTRKTGSTIIAVVFAAYFVYPTSILINQHIFEAIANPSENPNTPPSFVCPTTNTPCCPINEPCLNDSNCCSNNCRYVPSKGRKVCISQLTDFEEYRGLYSICYGETDMAKIEQILQEQADQYNNFLEGVYFAPQSYSQGTKTELRLSEVWNWISQRLGIIRETAWILLPLPGEAVPHAFLAVEMLVIDTMQFAVLTLLFLVIEIVITLTLFRDIAILIGGEPKIFGISHMV
ncbi:MAG: hypothetical protein N3G22_03040 [Candidatus Micrarchaeota archaeon]|nr:hypothetical protein [Candidatus Micrarchaeota archaeon]